MCSLFEDAFNVFALFTFSNPSPDGPSVDFMTMTCEGSPVRRLSTASSASKPPHFILTTEWLWYWKDNDGGWVEFGQVSVWDNVGAIKA